MVWQELDGQPAKITIYPNGKIEWNDCTQQMLGCPDSVSLFHDVAGGRLGFRKITRNTSNCLRVLFNEGLIYLIDAEAQLENAGLVFSEPFTTMPHMPMPPAPPGSMGDMGIWWIDLPE